jgi:ornithine cyclodeaminase/alanine dehydrogenase-like protein (mu-crystallin family)
MADGKRIETLRIGMIGSGFIAKFHLQGLIGVRNVVLAGVYSPTPAHREALARTHRARCRWRSGGGLRQTTTGGRE